MTLEEFDYQASPKLPAAQIRDLAALRWLSVGESVVLYGPVGVGKTHVAQGLGHLAIRQGAEVRFLKTSRLLATLADDLYELVSERTANGGSMILTSNRAPVDWYPLCPNPVVAESLLDRLINSSHQVFMNGPSYLPTKRPGANNQPQESPKEAIR